MTLHNHVSSSDRINAAFPRHFQQSLFRMSKAHRPRLMYDSPMNISPNHYAQQDFNRKVRQALEEIENTYPESVKTIKKKIEKDFKVILDEFVGVRESLKL